MLRKWVVIFLVLGVCVIPVTGFAWPSDHGTCDQQALEGTWNADVWTPDSSDTQAWDQCTLTIAPDGAVTAGGTYVDAFGTSSEVTGGHLTISSDCVIQGTIYTSNGTLNVERGGILQDGALAFAVSE